MIKSIRAKLIINGFFLIVFFVFLAWFLNSQYLESYYLHQKTKQLDEVADKIEEICQTGDSTAIYLYLEGLERNLGIKVLLLDPELKVNYSTFVRTQPNIRILRESIARMYKGENTTIIYNDPVLNTRFINGMYFMNNGSYLFLSSPLAAIKESAEVANTFLAFTGIVTIIIGGLLVLIFARWFTKPILELNDIARSMARLDFSQKYKVTTRDEIGTLGESINSLSDQLSRAINGLQEANASLEKDIARERQIDEMRKEFISNVSHELKTPIALIQGYAEGLKLNVNEDEADKNYYCEVIIDESKKMNKLVQDLLNLSQVESDAFKLEKINFNLSEHLQQIINKYQPIFDDKKIKLETDIPENLWVYADILRTEQIITNYLNNAVNHIDEKCRLRIKAEPQGNKARVFVFNTGCPIPDEALNKVFTSFYKVDKARRRSDGGTGLGLSVVRAIQEKDRNQYGVENLDEGVEFWFDLDIFH